MRYSRMFVRSRRDAPAGTESASAALLTRAGFIRQLGAGIYSMLPLGQRTVHRIQQILREEMVAIGCEELAMPVIQPADIWKDSGRWEEVGDELLRAKDRSGRDLVIAPTHEEVATDLVRREVRTYRQLPVQFFQFQTKFRDEPRPRAGLLRAREFLMKDAYSFHATQEDFERFYGDCCRAYLRIFARVGLPVRVVESGGGYMGEEMSHEFMLESPAGEDLLLICPTGDYAANQEFAAPSIEIRDGDPLPLEEVATPGCTTIDEVAAYLGIETDETLKAVFYDLGGQLVFVVIRGDLEVNTAKLAMLLGVEQLRPAGDDLIRSAGAAPGYASPVGVTGDILVIADESARAANLVAGANRDGYHLRNVNLGRDYQPDRIESIALLAAGDPCPECGRPLDARRGIEVGNIFTLGTKYSAPQRALFLDERDEPHPVLMGSYGIGIGRLMAAIAEHFHDERGLVWPASVAPYDAHLVLLGREIEVRSVGDGLYQELEDAGISVLYDDRDESAGVKFNDADLIGLPVRLTVGARSLAAGGVEIKLRTANRDEIAIVPVTEAPAQLAKEIDNALSPLERAADASDKRTRN